MDNSHLCAIRRFGSSVPCRKAETERRVLARDASSGLRFIAKAFTPRPVDRHRSRTKSICWPRLALTNWHRLNRWFSFDLPHALDPLNHHEPACRQQGEAGTTDKQDAVASTIKPRMNPKRSEKLPDVVDAGQNTQRPSPVSRLNQLGCPSVDTGHDRANR